MTAKKSGASPDKLLEYDEAFKVEALRLRAAGPSRRPGSWVSVPSRFTVGSVEVTRDLEVRALRAPQAGRAGTRHFKKASASACVRRRLGQPTR